MKKYFVFLLAVLLLLTSCQANKTDDQFVEVYSFHAEYDMGTVDVSWFTDYFDEHGYEYTVTDREVGQHYKVIYAPIEDSQITVFYCNSVDAAHDEYLYLTYGDIGDLDATSIVVRISNIIVATSYKGSSDLLSALGISVPDTYKIQNKLCYNKISKDINFDALCLWSENDRAYVVDKETEITIDKYLVSDETGDHMCVIYVTDSHLYSLTDTDGMVGYISYYNNAVVVSLDGNWDSILSEISK